MKRYFSKIVWVSFFILLVFNFAGITELSYWIVFFPLWGSVLFRLISIAIMDLIYKLSRNGNT